MTRPWTRSTKISMAGWSVVVLLQVAAVAGVYVRYSAPFVTTVNAQVDGRQIKINAPADGVLIKWSAQQGSEVQPGQAVGRIRLDGTGFSAPQQIIRSPGRGRVAMDLAREGERVAAGTTLALAFDSGGSSVTARVPTTVIDDVRVGAPVDLSVDAYSDTAVTGVVSEIQSSTAGEFSIYPSPDQNTSNPQRIKEWVPVKITFVGDDISSMRPGMNVTARIRKR